MADQAFDVATQGKRQANYSNESSKVCLSVLEQIKIILSEFEATCQELTQSLVSLESEANQAFLLLRNIENHHESTLGEAFSLKYTLQDKSSLLIAFDQPLGRR
jgi:ABC-type phosphate transport system auxiliary subunit